MRAAVYCRISDDREGGGLGVARQSQDCEALLHTRRWTLAASFTDNDLSAYTGKPRPGYEALMAAVKAGDADVIVAWHPDRLHRHPRELETFIDLLEATGCQVATVTAGEMDLSTPTGRMAARIVGATARYESEHKSARLRRKHEQLAAEGKLAGGGTRPFGFDPDRVTIRDDEATLIREAAGRILAGDGLVTVCADWLRRGVPTVTGVPWVTPVLRRVLTAPRTAGLREHRGKVVGDAQWAAILDRVTWERVRAVLLDPARRKGGPPRRYLLTGGLGRCGECGGRLFARPKEDGRRQYVCPKGVNFSGCGRVVILADWVEGYAVERLFAAVVEGRLTAVLRARRSQPAEVDVGGLEEDERRLEELEVAHFADGALSRAGYLSARERLTARIEARRRSLVSSARGAVLASVPDEEAALRRVWDERGHEWRRAVLTEFMQQVVVDRAVKGRNRFDPDRVRVEWAG